MNGAAQPTTTQTEGQRASRDWIIVGLFVFAGTVLRFSTIETRGLWLDEAITVAQATQSIPAIIDSLIGGVHPPLFHVLMHYWMLALGTGELSIRTFAAIWGILSIPAAYWVGRVIYDRRTGLFASAIVSYAPYLVWYSQEARMYSMMFFFALMSMGFLFLAVRDNRLWHWIGYGLATLGGMFSHYFFIFFVIGEVAYYVLAVLWLPHLEKRRAGDSVFQWRHPLSIFKEFPTLWPWLISTGAFMALFGVWVEYSVFISSLQSDALVSSATGSGLGYGQTAPMLAWRFNDVGMVLVQMFAGFHPAPEMYALVAMWPLGISVALVATDFLRPLGRRSMLPPLAASGIVVVIMLGMWQGQVLASRYFIGLAAPAIVLSAAVVSGMPRHARTAVVTLLIILTIGFWADQSFDPKNIMRYDYREAIAMVVQDKQPGDVVIYEPFYLTPVMTYYVPHDIASFAFPQYGVNAGVRNRGVPLGQDLDRVSRGAPNVWLVASYQNIPTVANDIKNTVQWYLDHHYWIVKDIQLNGVELYQLGAPASRMAPIVPGVTP